MNSKRTILTPVKREDFDTAFSSNADLTKTVLPEDFFESAIDHLRKFAVGPYCWFIANATNGLTQSAGGMIEQLTGIALYDFINGTPDRLFSQMHPEDVAPMFAFTKHWIAYFTSLPFEKKIHIHPTIYIRLKNREQLHKWVAVQYADQIIDLDGNILFGLTVITDISHVKKEGSAMMSVLDSYDETCQHFFCSDGNSVFEDDKLLPKLTTREIEVLHYLASGNSSKQIAAELYIAIKTIDNHRQNMLHKTKTKSTGELVSYAIRSGFI